jgi:hypothetical protein
MRRYMMNILRRERLVDELVEAYVDWREACARVDDAYRSWEIGTTSRSKVAFGLYTAALDEEEQAAEGYADLVRRADQLSWSARLPSVPLGGSAWGEGYS